MSQGVWTSAFDWPVIGVQMTLLPDGRILSFGTNQKGQQGAAHVYDVWDPATNTHTTLEHHVHTDIFCSAAIVVPETGEVLIAGGDTRPFAGPNNGVTDVNSFNYMTNELVPSPTGDMTYGRWYPTALTLADGKVLVIGGRDGVGDGIATPEIYTPGVGWKTLDGASNDDFASGWYYTNSWVASDGRVVSIPTDGKGKFVSIDPSGNGRTLSEIATPFKKGPDTPSIMFDKDKVLTIASDNSAWIVDFSGATPKFTRTAAPDGGHFWSNMTVLADGTVLLTGGSKVANELKGITYTAAIWHPESGNWTYDTDASIPRLYHSSTLLMPDGTVLSLGGGAPGPLVNLNGEIYKPSYLFNDDGTEAVRPVILDAPKELEQGQDFLLSIDNPGAIKKLQLVKNGSATHGFSPETRTIDLDFKLGADGKLHVVMPDNANVITPGDWMLFAVNGKGTPSIAATIHVDTGGEVHLPDLDVYATLSGVADYNATAEVFNLTKGANQVGNVFSNSAIDLTKNFAIKAEIKFTGGEGGTGGISFVLHNDPVKGDATGYGSAVGGAYGINNGLAFEFDVSNDGPRFRDIAADHFAIVDTDAPIGASQLGASYALKNLEDAAWHKVVFQWNAATKTLVYSLDGKMIGQLNKDISAYFGGENKAFFGFTGATGAGGALQQVKIDSVIATYTKSHASMPEHNMNGPMEHTLDPMHLEDSVHLSGGARYDSNTHIATLTKDAVDKVGAEMSNLRVDLKDDFSLNFDVFLGTKDGGGNGLAFVLHNDPVADRALGAGGDGLGANGIRMGLGIEFDTLNNGAGKGDIAADHTRFFDTDSVGGRNITKAVSLGNIEDGLWHNVRVAWDVSAKTLTYWVDGQQAGTLTRDIAKAFLGSDMAYFGFTGATDGTASNLQMVRLNNAKGTFETTTHETMDLTSPAMMTVGGAGYNRAGGAIVLTQDLPAQKGGVMSDDKIDLMKNFTIKFDAFFGSRDGYGGEGIAFVLHDDARGNMAIGSGGANLGAGGISKGLGIEFDTFNEGAGAGDIAADHTNFFDTDAPIDTRNLTAAKALGNIEDGKWHAITVKWDAMAHMLYYGIDNHFGGALNADIVHDYFGDSTMVHFGVTGSTGGAINLQQVRFVSVDAMIA